MFVIFALVAVFAVFLINYSIQISPLLAPDRSEWLSRIFFSLWVLTVPTIFFIEYAWFKPEDARKADLEHMRHLQGLGRDFWLGVSIVLAGALLGKWG